MLNIVYLNNAIRCMRFAGTTHENRNNEHTAYRYIVYYTFTLYWYTTCVCVYGERGDFFTPNRSLK